VCQYYIQKSGEQCTTTLAGKCEEDRDDNFLLKLTSLVRFIVEYDNQRSEADHKKWALTTSDDLGRLINEITEITVARIHCTL